MKKKNLRLIIGFIILGVLVLGLSSYIVYDKLISKDSGHVNKSTKNYKIDDYIIVNNYNFHGASSVGQAGTVKKIEFKNLPTTLTSEFYDKHYTFTSTMSVSSSAGEKERKLSNKIFYDISGNILSVYELDKSDLIEYPYERYDDPQAYTTYDFYSVNINLDDQKLITNQELLEMYKINPSDVFEKILNDIADFHKDDGLLIPTDSQAFDTMSSKEFKKNIKTYIKQINNRFDKIVLYVKNNNVYVAYDEEDIVDLVGLKSQERYAAVNSDLETRVLSLGDTKNDESNKANIENNPNKENSTVLNKFLDAKMVGCPNKTLRDTITEYNSYENLSATYKMDNVNGQDYLILKMLAPSDTLIAVVSLDDEGNAFLADAEAESIKRNLSNPDDVSFYSVLEGTKALCN